MERLLEEIRSTPQGPTAEIAYAVLMPPLAARITGDTKLFDIAEKAARTVLSSPSVTPRIAWDVRLGLAVMAVVRGNVPSALEQYQELRPTQGTALLHTSIDRVLGLLAHTTGRTDIAISHFEDALAFCHKAGYRPEYAWASHDFASALLQRNGSGDIEKAVSLLNESLAIATELGMTPLIERVNALAERIGAQPAKTPAYPDGLTAREVEVLRLIAAGKTNPQIAEMLFISANTVGNHVSNILNKTNTSSRSEAVAYGVRHGLV